MPVIESMFYNSLIVRANEQTDLQFRYIQPVNLLTYTSKSQNTARFFSHYIESTQLTTLFIYSRVCQEANLERETRIDIRILEMKIAKWNHRKCMKTIC